MTAFPQLSSGAIGQFPFRRKVSFRTLVNESADGSRIVASDPDFQERQWVVNLGGLTDTEWLALETLFGEVEGQLKSFLFLEPGANLLSWSELLNDSVWEADAGIALLDNQADPLGGNSATLLSNSGATGSLRQRRNIPASYRYVGSVWARTADTGVSLRLDDDGVESEEVTIASDNQWKRYTVGYNGTSNSEWMVFRVTIPTAAAVEVFGPQLEAQPSASTYKRSLQQAGVYPNARFAQDVLTDEATAIDQHSGVAHISWTPSQI